MMGYSFPRNPVQIESLLTRTVHLETLTGRVTASSYVHVHGTAKFETTPPDSDRGLIVRRSI